MIDISYVVIGVLILIIAVLEAIKIFSDLQGHRHENHKKIEIGSSMTIGGREVQEDQFGTMTTQAGTMAVLSDGAGKSFGGRIASRITVDTCLHIFEDYNAFHNPQYYFRKAFHCANKEILKALQDETYGSASAGCVLVREGYLYYALVGNVRVCVYREGNLVPVSAGHTVAVLAEEKFREGKISRQDALALLEDQRLYNYLGKDDFKDIELFDAPICLKQGDIILLMSDGIYDLLGFKEIEEILAGDGSCQEKAFAVIELVNQSPVEEKDNASIVLLGMGRGVGMA
ncbi:MAG: PP2C family protein-serine/threonine phosphatase [Roseburia sp.]